MTYQILQGDRQRFRIDPVSGELTVIRGLDYELSNHFSLTVGTVEGAFEGPEGFSCKVRLATEGPFSTKPKVFGSLKVYQPLKVL